MTEPTNFDFRKWFDNILPEMLRPAKQIVAMDRQHIPMLIIFGYDGHMMPIGIPQFGDLGTKEATTALQQKLGAKTDTIAAAVFISEVWTVSNKDVEPG